MRWMDMLSDSRIGDAAEVIAPNGEKVTMGQVREAWLSRQAEIDKKEATIRQAQGELANVFSILQNEKVAIEAAREEIRNRQAEVETADPEVAGTNFVNSLKDEIAQIKKQMEQSHKTSVEMADIYLDDVWERAHEKYKDDLPEGVTRNDVLKFAMQQGIKDRRGVVDIDAALSRIVEPRIRERQIKEAEDRGARKKEEEILLRSVGSPSSFQTRGGATEEGKKFTNLDSAFEAAAKDAAVFFGPGLVQ